MKIFKSNGSLCNFYPTSPKIFFILKMSKRALFKNPKLKLSSQMDSDAFVKIMTWKIFFKKGPELLNSEF